MKKTNRTLLVVLVWVLACSLLLLVAAALVLGRGPSLLSSAQQSSQDESEDTVDNTPGDTVTEDPSKDTTEGKPQPEVFTLSFAGDCTLGNRKGRTGEHTFIGTVGSNYAYPLADVQKYFATDDCTFINLEGPLTDSDTSLDKTFVFKGPKEYVNILTSGSVEFANVVNNHAHDYGDKGYQDTLDVLDWAGIYYAENKNSVLFTTESGLTIGVYSVLDPYDAHGIPEKLADLRTRGAEVVVVSLHWGLEYYYHPNGAQVSIAHAAIDGGADIVYGHHSHVLQKIEQYKDGVIFYSLGNFCFGGNMSPPDKDTAILQQQIIRQPDGTIEMGELTIIPCYVSGILTYGNDYQPTPIEETAEGYTRVLTKLAGKFPLEKLEVAYRDDLQQTQPEE